MHMISLFPRDHLPIGETRMAASRLERPQTGLGGAHNPHGKDANSTR